ncbi:RHS repeat-associated core domain-containing protein, partial [Pseudomonas syringae]
SVVSYKYDAFGRRIEKTVDGHTTEFLWQGERLIAESADNRYRTYIYEPGTFRPLAMLDGEGPLKATPFYYQLDHLGTPQELTDYSGEIMWSAKYRAYGNLATLDIAEIDNPLRFQGQYFDAETGLHYNRHRYYNPGTGRFLTPDPIKLAGGLNNYQYVPNPTGWVDPLGLIFGAIRAAVVRSAGTARKAASTVQSNIRSQTAIPNCPGSSIGNPIGKTKAPETKASVNQGEPSLPIVSGSHKALNDAKAKDSHHIIQDAAVRDLPGYDRNAAPAVQLPGPSTKKGTPHYEATQAQRRSGGGTYRLERIFGYRALRKAGVSKDDAKTLIRGADEHFKGIGVTPETTTRIPGNRRK